MTTAELQPIADAASTAIVLIVIVGALFVMRSLWRSWRRDERIHKLWGEWTEEQAKIADYGGSTRDSYYKRALANIKRIETELHALESKE